ncbi:MAG TPA: DUF368 domain-containing protein [Salinimicrobium sp.]|nr:DUF368 domain-containing protein [Salinimicrobium sp.]
MQASRTFSDKIFLILKGIGMGAANKVPGVSGGMVAFVAGFYEEFIYSLQRVNSKAFKFLINGRFKSFYLYINGRFLTLLILGMVISYFSVSLLLDYLLQQHELYVWSAFFGMILGSIYYVGQDFDDWTKRNIGLILLGFIAGISISFFDPANENDNLWFVFLCGIIGVSGQTLPGLSGSFIIMLLGNYVLLLVDSVNSLYLTIVDIFQGDFSFIYDETRIRLLQVLIVFTLGSLVGLVTLSHLLGYLLKHFKTATYASIIGFITGSLGVVWPWKHKLFRRDETGNEILNSSGEKIIESYVRYWPDVHSKETWIAVFFIFVGILIVLALERYEKRISKGKSA